MKTSQIELHTHPYFNAYGIEEIIKAMGKNEINIIGLEYLNKQAFLDVQWNAADLAKHGYDVRADSLAVKIEREGKEFYLLKAAEHSTKDNFHLLTIGYDNIESQSTRKIIESALKQDSLVILDHPFVNINYVGKEITEQQEKELGKICKEYSGSIALEWNSYCIPWLRKIICGRDVNENAINLSKKLASEGHNVPVVTDTDLHARNTTSLKAIGTGRIKSEVNLTSGRAIINSLKQNIFSGRYENNCKTVPPSHFIPNFALPYVLEKFYYRPRG